MEIPNSREMLFDNLLMVKGENKIKNQSVPEHAVYFNSEPSMIFKKPEQTHAYSWWNVQRSKNSFQTTIPMVKVFFSLLSTFSTKTMCQNIDNINNIQHWHSLEIQVESMLPKLTWSGKAKSCTTFEQNLTQTAASEKSF